TSPAAAPSAWAPCASAPPTTTAQTTRTRTRSPTRTRSCSPCSRSGCPSADRGHRKVRGRSPGCPELRPPAVVSPPIETPALRFLGYEGSGVTSARRDRQEHPIDSPQFAHL